MIRPSGFFPHGDDIRVNLSRMEVEPERYDDPFADPWSKMTADEIVDYYDDHFNHTSAQSMFDEMLNLGRIQRHSRIYEEIFEVPGLSRRVDREVFVPPQGGVRAITPAVGYSSMILVQRWLAACYPGAKDSHSVEESLGANPFPFINILDNSIPRALTVDSWIGAVALHTTSIALTLHARRQHQFVLWKAAYGNGTPVTKTDARGKPDTVLPFIGTPSPGRLIWLRPHGFPSRVLAGYAGGAEGILAYLHRVEASLVELACRIADQVVRMIMYEVILPGAEATGEVDVCSEDDIGMAVREILGVEWFELGFDVEGRLREWTPKDVLEEVMGGMMSDDEGGEEDVSDVDSEEWDGDRDEIVAWMQAEGEKGEKKVDSEEQLVQEDDDRLVRVGDEEGGVDVTWSYGWLDDVD